MGQVKISVITSCYNSERFMGEAIESILGQSYSDFEYILINDGSIDNTIDIINEYAVQDNRIVVIEKENTGVADSLNIGIDHAKGEWIVRLDADDIAMRDRLHNQLKFVGENNAVVLVGGGCIEIDKTGKFVKKHIYPGDHNKLMNHLETWQPFFPHSSALYNKAHVKRMGGYNRKFIRSQDWDLWLRIGETAQISCLQMPVVKLRKHSGMISNAKMGRLQLIMGISATVCHFCRKLNLLDPSQMDDEIWQDFLKWVELRIEQEGFLLEKQAWQDIRNIWYSNPDAGILRRAAFLIKEIVHNSSSRKAIVGRFRKNDLALKLARESCQLPYF